MHRIVLLEMIIAQKTFIALLNEKPCTTEEYAFDAIIYMYMYLIQILL